MISNKQIHSFEVASGYERLCSLFFSSRWVFVYNSFHLSNGITAMTGRNLCYDSKWNENCAWNTITLKPSIDETLWWSHNFFFEKSCIDSATTSANDLWCCCCLLLQSRPIWIAIAHAHQKRTPIYINVWHRF